MEERKQSHTRVPRREEAPRARSRWRGVDVDERLRSGPPVPRSRRRDWARVTEQREVRGRSGGRPR